MPAPPRVAALALALLAGLAPLQVGVAAGQPAAAAAPDPTPWPVTLLRGLATADAPLAGRTIVLDPGHQLGNSRHPREINRLVVAGPTRKACNTTGTATDDGFPEATFAWRVARLAQRQLRRLGARVVLTRSSNSRDAWGPCVDARGRRGGEVGADLTLSIHADGSYARGAHGFHVIAPASLAGWTDDIARPSRRLARDVRAALDRRFDRATYIAGGDGLDVRSDLGTLNLSDVPVAMVELGNMRDAREARRMRSRAGQAAYARRLVAGMRRFLS